MMNPFVTTFSRSLDTAWRFIRGERVRPRTVRAPRGQRPTNPAVLRGYAFFNPLFGRSTSRSSGRVLWTSLN
jgi:hypothetical protein